MADRHDWSRPWGGRGRARQAAAVVALHVLLLLGLRLAADRIQRPREVGEASQTLVEVLLNPAPPRRPVAIAMPAVPVAPTVRPSRQAADGNPAASRRHPAPPPSRKTTGDGEPAAPGAGPGPLPPAGTPSPTLAAAAPASAASQPRLGSILDTPETRAAIREAGRAPLQSERTADATGIAPPEGANARLARGLAAAQKGDCLKGEFAGSGGGLLSLPFFVAAELSGNCSRK